MKIILYQPDIAGNLGAIMRLSACFDVSLEVIEPCGFPLTAKALRRTAMDYGAPENLVRHTNWDAYNSPAQPGRLVLLTTKASTRLDSFTFEKDDRLLFGQESAGVPDNVHAAADASILIPMTPNVRSFNLATSAAITVYEALRQTNGLPA
jgi:tRNA (cytidine/uridine-2'-O-)-methyltransferase